MSSQVMTSLASLIRGQDYYGRYARMYKKNLHTIPSFKIVFSLTAGKVIDVGCGIGYLSSLFSDYVGIDINKTALVIAKKSTPHDFVLADGMHLPFVSSSFETCISYDSIEHVPNIRKTLLEMKRVANTVVISYVDFESYYRLLTYDETHKPMPKPDSLAFFLKDESNRVGVYRTSGLFEVPIKINRYLERYFPNQIVIFARQNLTCDSIE